MTRCNLKFQGNASSLPTWRRKYRIYKNWSSFKIVRDTRKSKYRSNNLNSQKISLPIPKPSMASKSSRKRKPIEPYSAAPEVSPTTTSLEFNRKIQIRKNKDHSIKNQYPNSNPYNPKWYLQPAASSVTTSNPTKNNGTNKKAAFINLNHSCRVAISQKDSTPSIANTEKINTNHFLWAWKATIQSNWPLNTSNKMQILGRRNYAHLPNWRILPIMIRRLVLKGRGSPRVRCFFRSFVRLLINACPVPMFQGRQAPNYKNHPTKLPLTEEIKRVTVRPIKTITKGTIIRS